MVGGVANLPPRHRVIDDGEDVGGVVVFVLYRDLARGHARLSRVDDDGKAHAWAAQSVKVDLQRRLA